MITIKDNSRFRCCMHEKKDLTARVQDFQRAFQRVFGRRPIGNFPAAHFSPHHHNQAASPHPFATPLLCDRMAFLQPGKSSIVSTVAAPGQKPKCIRSAGGLKCLGWNSAISVDDGSCNFPREAGKPQPRPHRNYERIGEHGRKGHRWRSRDRKRLRFEPGMKRRQPFSTDVS